MKRGIYLPFLVFAMIFATVDVVMAQARIARTEFLCYDKREDAKQDIRTNIENYITIAPELQFESAEGKVRRVYEQKITIPATWNDYNTYLHLENIGGDYSLFINGEQVTPPVDMFTPSEFYLSPYLVQGENVVTDWQKWDLSGLGKVAKVRLNFQYSEEMGGRYGFTIPGYFAYDDVAVRFEK